MQTPPITSPLWSAASFGDTADASPLELSALGAHMAECKPLTGGLFDARCAAEALHGFVAGRMVAPMSLAPLLLALGTGAVSPWVALIMVAAAISVGPLMGAVVDFSPSRDDIALRHFYRLAAGDLGRTLWCGAWLLAQLAAQALLMTDAIVRALYRMIFSQRHLLQWTTAAAAQARAQTTLPALCRQHGHEPLLALVLLAALFAVGTPTPWLATTLSLLWAASPLWTWWVSRPCFADSELVLNEVDRAYFEGVARDAWRYFERCVVAEENHLPPDNNARQRVARRDGVSI